MKFNICNSKTTIYISKHVIQGRNMLLEHVLTVSAFLRMYNIAILQPRRADNKGLKTVKHS